MSAARFTADRAATVGAAAPERYDLDARLSRLLAADAEAERRARLFRTPREEREMLMMARPVRAERAFALFGLLLGTLPPAAIFIRLFGYGLNIKSDTGILTFPMLCLAMNVVCALVGRQMGKVVGRIVDRHGRESYVDMLASSIMGGLLWGVGTGGSGGALFFGIGAVGGAVCAALISLVAFPVFATLHRLLARGGMIDARHLRPLAWAVAATAAALVLSPSLLPY
jgi:hypothetical protein